MGRATLVPASRTASRASCCVLCYASSHNLLVDWLGIPGVEKRRSKLGNRTVPAIRVRSLSLMRIVIGVIHMTGLSDGALPYAEVPLSNIAAQQPYDISLHLVVPANEANLALGNFMASLTLLTPSNNTIALARKPVRALAVCLALLFSPTKSSLCRRLCYQYMLPLGHISITDQVLLTSTFKCSATLLSVRLVPSHELSSDVTTNGSPSVTAAAVRCPYCLDSFAASLSTTEFGMRSCYDVLSLCLTPSHRPAGWSRVSR